MVVSVYHGIIAGFHTHEIHWVIEITCLTPIAPFTSGTQVIVIGREAAREGFREVYGFLSVQHKTRLTTMILVSSGEAGEVPDIKPERMFHKNTETSGSKWRMNEIKNSWTSGLRF